MHKKKLNDFVNFHVEFYLRSFDVCLVAADSVNLPEYKTKQYLRQKYYFPRFLMKIVAKPSPDEFHQCSPKQRISTLVSFEFCWAIQKFETQIPSRGYHSVLGSGITKNGVPSVKRALDVCFYIPRLLD